MRRLFRLRNVRVFVSGWTLSVFGDWAMFIVLGVWTKDLTGSNSAAGLVFFALGVPSLLSPFAGLVVDRLRRRPLLIGIYAAEALVVLALLFVHDRGDVWIIYAVALFYGAAGTFGASARSALMTVMLPRELLAESNGMLQTLREGLRLVAPLVGALIYAAAGGGAVAVLDSASFAAVVIALALMRIEEPRFEREEHRFATELLAGARHVFGTLPLRQIILATGVCLLVVGFAETLIFAVLDEGLHRPASFFGVLSSLQGVGAIAGGLTAARTMRRVGDVKLVGFGMVLLTVGEITFISHSLVLVLAGIAVAGAGIAWLIVGYATAIQLRTPLRLQGRVLSASDTLINTPQTVSIALGALLVSVVDYRLLVVVMGVVVAACGAYLLTREPEPVAEKDPVFA
ncbi:MAG: MFS transporter [Actinobacteria bacterium]|nr:MAG: MFS transporter [Actinomycetota bacterium]